MTSCSQNGAEKSVSNTNLNDLNLAGQTKVPDGKGDLNPNLSCVIKVFNIEDCCVTFAVTIFDHLDYAYFELETGDGTVLTDDQLNSGGTTKYCYRGSGQYTMVLKVYDDNDDFICSYSVNVEIVNIDFGTSNDFCPLGCISYLCWKDFIGFFDCFNFIEIMLEDGTLVQYTIPEIPVVGGYSQIADALKNVMESNNYGGYFASEHFIQDCSKGSNPTPGFFFINTSIIITRICGTNCDGGPEECILGDDQNQPYSFKTFNCD